MQIGVINKLHKHPKSVLTLGKLKLELRDSGLPDLIDALASDGIEEGEVAELLDALEKVLEITKKYAPQSLSHYYYALEEIKKSRHVLGQALERKETNEKEVLSFLTMESRLVCLDEAGVVGPVTDGQEEDPEETAEEEVAGLKESYLPAELIQSTTEWCWATCAKMVAQDYVALTASDPAIRTFQENHPMLRSANPDSIYWRSDADIEGLQNGTKNGIRKTVYKDNDKSATAAGYDADTGEYYCDLIQEYIVNTYKPSTHHVMQGAPASSIVNALNGLTETTFGEFGSLSAATYEDEEERNRLIHTVASGKQIILNIGTANGGHSWVCTGVNNDGTLQLYDPMRGTSQPYTVQQVFIDGFTSDIFSGDTTIKCYSAVLEVEDYNRDWGDTDDEDAGEEDEA